MATCHRGVDFIYYGHGQRVPKASEAGPKGSSSVSVIKNIKVNENTLVARDFFFFF